MFKTQKRRCILFTFAFVIVACAATMILCNLAINNSAKGKLYTDVQKIPFNKTGLLLGTGKFLSNGSVNPYYSNRISAAAELLLQKKIKYIVISGDNSRKDYNEPQQMKDDLVHLGIDSTVIFLDYAGFRTFDSMVRLKEIFGQKKVTVISQQFHNERAIYIGSKQGIEAIGFNAGDVEGNKGLKVEVREKFARVKVFIDAVTGKKPKFLGEKVWLPE